MSDSNQSSNGSSVFKYVAVGLVTLGVVLLTSFAVSNLTPNTSQETTAGAEQPQTLDVTQAVVVTEPGESTQDSPSVTTEPATSDVSGDVTPPR